MTEQRVERPKFIDRHPCNWPLPVQAERDEPLEDEANNLRLYALQLERERDEIERISDARADEILRAADMLATVTAERDRLREAAQAVIASPIGQRDFSLGDYGEIAMEKLEAALTPRGEGGKVLPFPEGTFSDEALAHHEDATPTEGASE